jgi:tetratricopeptide (TPR) repeat protein
MRFFIEERESDFNIVVANFDKNYERIEKTDPKSPMRLYLMAQMQLELAVCQAKMGELMSAGYHVQKAYGQLEDNKRKFPAFAPNLIGLGLMHCLIGTVPSKYRWAANVMGYDGNLEQGMRELYQAKDFVKKNNFYCAEELDFIYVYGLLYMSNEKKKAWSEAKALQQQHPNNLLYTYLATVVAYANNYNEEGLNILNARPKGAAYTPFVYLDYLTGLGKLRRLDSDAEFYFERFLKDKSRRNFLKDASQKIAWCHLLKGDKEGSEVDADRQALREAEANDVPNLLLLRARLLCDGGYYQKAINELAGHKPSEFKAKKEQAEFVYRAGRIYQEWGQIDKAIPYFETAIVLGAGLPQWFEASAALNLGLIYEDKGNLIKAKKYLQICIDSKNVDFKNGLEQKAKSALERIKKKEAAKK